MNHGIKRYGMVAVPAAVAVLTLSACGGGSADGPGEGSGDGGTVEISYLIDNAEATIARAEAVAEAFMAENDDVVVTIETRPGGGDGDNIVKTRLATGEMTDLFWYNSGSLLQALDPAANLVPLGDEEWASSLDEGFVASVSHEGQMYGAPGEAAVGGGILYNRDIYEELGLEVPTTWAEFMANNEEIAASGVAPIIQSYGDTWTSQLLVLADYHNVAAQDADWADKYTANDPSAKFAQEPALGGFEKLEEVAQAGFLNEDYATLMYDQALVALAEGRGAHYPMLTFAVPALLNNDPANAERIGFFGQPGDDGSEPGMSLWQPGSLYIPTSTTGEKLDAAKRFVAFAVSAEGCDAAAAAAPPSGPYVSSNCTLPDDVPQALTDMQEYVDAGTAVPALEFLSPVKGPNLEKLTVEVGSGITSAADGAARYDEDVKAQAEQLGLEGW